MTDYPNGLRTFRGAVAIITGGASGIGRALAEALADRGAEVVVADLQRELADETAAMIRSRGAAATAAHLDVSDFAATACLVEETAKQCGRLDYMFNNAGIGILGEVRDHAIEDWNRIIDVNLLGVVHGVTAAYRVMLAQGFGHIVNTASVQGLVPTPLMASYGATKHAVVALSMSLRIEAAATGIRVSVVCPGVIRTPLLTGGRYGKVLLAASVERQRAYFERVRPMDPVRFAPRVLAQVARNKAIIVVPYRYKAMWWIDRLSPALGRLLAGRLFAFSKRTLTDSGDITASSDATSRGGHGSDASRD